MADKQRTRLRPDARRAQLIELGVEMLATRTLDELSVEDIATQAGISRGLLFHYFASKQEFHLEVARAAAQELIERTEPDRSRPPLDALRGALTAFMDYVIENPDNYKSLVRGAASGDTEMRAIFDRTRSTLAGRIIGVLDDLDLPLGPRASLAVHGWVAFVEECVVRAIDDRALDDPQFRTGLLDMLTKALPAVVVSSSDEDVNSLVAILTADQSISVQ
jgi:AcrR family transcriptional regulator